MAQPGTMAEKMSTAAVVLYKAAALAQWVLLVVGLDRLRPHWPAFAALFGTDYNAYVWGGFAFHVGMLLLLNAAFYVVYKLQLPYFEQFRVSAKPWPWQQGGEAAARLRSNLLVGGALQLFNIAMTPFLAMGSWDLIRASGFTTSAKSYPSGLSVVGHVFAFMVVEDVLFYWAHRLLHHKAIYKYIHKVHHRFYYSVSLAAEATHPVEYILANVVPFSAGPVLLGAHAVTYYTWFVLRMIETVAHHSGYEFPWLCFSLLPFQGTSVEHDLHHSVNTGNYASFFTWMDAAFGTAIPEEKGDLQKHKAAKGVDKAAKAS